MKLEIKLLAVRISVVIFNPKHIYRAFFVIIQGIKQETPILGSLDRVQYPVVDSFSNFHKF